MFSSFNSNDQQTHLFKHIFTKNISSYIYILSYISPDDEERKKKKEKTLKVHLNRMKLWTHKMLEELLLFIYLFIYSYFCIFKIIIKKNTGLK
jgi:hypothetical protein